jgi:drug/metabolite transporter (DMT)-like permease
VAMATLTFATFPILTALVEPILFREDFHTRSLAAALGAFAGMIGVAWPSGHRHLPLMSVIWGLTSAASFAALSLINRDRVRQYPSRVVALYQHAGATVCLLPFLFLAPVAPTPTDIGLLLILGIFCTALAHTLYIQSLSRLTATSAGLVACLEPVYTIMFAVVFLSEPFPWRVAVSAVLILGSATLAARPTPHWVPPQRMSGSSSSLCP